MDRIYALDLTRAPKDRAQATPEILDLLERRNLARTAKDFEQSDQLRDQLTKLGIEIKDSAAGQSWNWL